MKIDFQDRIDDYLLNRMSGEERKSFESDAANDAELKEQLQFTKTIQQTTKSRNEKLAAMEEWKNDYVWKDESHSEFHLPTLRSFYWMSGVAAVFIAGVIVFNLYRPSMTEIAMDTASHPTEASSKNSNVSFKGRRNDVDVETLLAMGDYSKALARLEKDEADIRSSLMLNDRKLYSRGEICEDATTDRDYFEANLARVLYLKAQALIGLERNDDARAVLDEIRQSKSDYAIKADSLYHQLK